jgi:glycosyltransferase involved in cell wall biosynthesis
MKVTFFQNFPNQLQAQHLEAIAELDGFEVTLVVGESLPGWRARLGWSEARHDRVEVVRVGAAQQAADIVRATPPEAVLVFSGIGASSAVNAGFKEAQRLRRRMGIMAEPGAGTGLKGPLRLGREWLRARTSAAHVQFVLAIGGLGHAWYQRAGYGARVFPYAYFVEGPLAAAVASGRDGEQTPHLLFVGQLVKRKGVDTLIDALFRLKDEAWVLEVAGDGPMRPQVEAAASILGKERVRVLGSRPHREVLHLMGRTDALLLPSRWDGWGAVVNEALLGGARVVCSDRCGAAVLVTSRSQGAVFRAGSAEQLAVGIRDVVRNGAQTPAARRSLRNWAERIQPQAGAQYFAAILGAVFEGAERPTPPWKA